MAAFFVFEEKISPQSWQRGTEETERLMALERVHGPFDIAQGKQECLFRKRRVDLGIGDFAEDGGAMGAGGGG